MHDPMTVAIEIRSPFPSKNTTVPGVYRAPPGYRAPLITIWHCDPEKDGSDDSCDWFNHKRRLTPELRSVQEAKWGLETLLDNKPHWPDSREHHAWQVLKEALSPVLHAPSRTRFWHVHPRWHVWHWRIQIHPVQKLKRWLFTRCKHCGQRFSWGYAPIGDGYGPMWFKSEIAWHHECARDVGVGASEAAKGGDKP